MREQEILHHRNAVVLTLAVLGLASACKSDASGPAEARASEAAAPQASDPDRAPGPTAPEPAPAVAPASAKDPERADKLADLDAMCKALNHDYDDGTLTDYYADIAPRTEWGKAQRDAGNESIQPGRLLEKAIAELSPGAKDPTLGHCRTLLDYLDDVE